MKELIKKSFLEESEVLLNSEMVALVGGGDSLSDPPPVYPACQSSCINGCTKSCMTSCSSRKSS